LDMESHFLPKQSWVNSPVLCFPLSLGWQACTTMPSLWLKWGLMNSQIGLASNWILAFQVLRIRDTSTWLHVMYLKVWFATEYRELLF
jgi:hypothetical protein